MSNFKSMVQGTPAWHEKYNGDVGLIFPKTATYAGGVFTVQELPAYDSESSPAQFPLSFAAPAAFTRGDRLRVWSKDIELLDSGLKPLKNAAFKAEAIVALNVDYPAGRAFLVAGGSGAVGVLPAQTVIVVIAADRSANVTLTNPGGSGSAYAGTRLVVKQGNNIPEDEEDGTVFDAGKATAYTVQGLENGLPYVIRAFAYNSDGDFQSDTTGAVESFTPSDLPTDPPGNVLSFKATAGNKFVILTWMDPADSSYTTWAGTMIRRKLGGYPTDETDGELVVDSKIRNQYQSQGFLDEGLSNTETYFYQAFPYSTAGVYNRSEANRVEASPRPTEFEYLNALLSDATWTAPSDGWYRVTVVGKSGNGGDGGISRYGGQVGESYPNGAGGGGGGSGGVAVSELFFRQGQIINIAVNNEASKFGTNTDLFYMIATAGSDGESCVTTWGYNPGGIGGVGGIANGGNLINLGGSSGGNGGDGSNHNPQRVATPATEGGNQGGKAGMFKIISTPNMLSGPGAGGARLQGDSFSNFIAKASDIGAYLSGGDGVGDGGSTGFAGLPGIGSPELAAGPNMKLYGGGGAGSGAALRMPGSSMPGGVGAQGSPGVVIIERDAGL